MTLAMMVSCLIDAQAGLTCLLWSGHSALELICAG